MAVTGTFNTVSTVSSIHTVIVLILSAPSLPAVPPLLALLPFLSLLPVLLVVAVTRTFNTVTTVSSIHTVIVLILSAPSLLPAPTLPSLLSPVSTLSELSVQSVLAIKLPQNDFKGFCCYYIYCSECISGKMYRHIIQPDDGTCLHFNEQHGWVRHVQLYFAKTKFFRSSPADDLPLEEPGDWVMTIS